MIAIIIGTRAELIKTFPIMLELQKRKQDYLFIHTGQHNLGKLCEEFKIKKPDIILTKEPEKTTKFFASCTKISFWNLTIILKLIAVLRKIKNLKYVLYHGDTASTMCAAIASSKLLNPFKKWKNIHLEAGLRSESLFEPFPEEISRIIADRFSDILIAVSKRTENNLKKYKNKKIILMGNTIIDSAGTSLKLAKKRKLNPLSKEKFALISIHRHENIKDKKRLESIIEILKAISIASYFPLHDNTKKQLIKFRLYNELKNIKNIKIINSIDYIPFIYQMSRCSLIVCDGGSMQEESLIFKKPCIILRKATERQEGLKTNFQFLSKLNVKATKTKIKEFSDDKFRIKEFKNPYGRQGVSRKIGDLLR